MKVKAIRPFKDKDTGKVHNTGEVFTVTAERLAEIKKAGRFVVEVENEPVEKAVKKTAKEEKK